VKRVAFTEPCLLSRIAALTLARRAACVTFELMKWFRIAGAFGATVIFAGVAIAQDTLGIRDQLMNLKIVNYFPAHAAHANV